MRQVLLDQGVPKGVKRFLTAHFVETAYERGWSTISNGKLLSAVEEAGFEVFVSADQNLRHQQNLSGRAIGIVVIGSNIWPVIAANPQPIVEAVGSVFPGAVSFVEYPKPARRASQP